MINTFFSETLEQHQPQVGVYSHADIPKAILIKKFVFVLYVRVLPDVERESFRNYDPSTSSDQWYNNEDVVGEIRYTYSLTFPNITILFHHSDAWRTIRNFFSYNKYEVWKFCYFYFL